MKISFVKVWVDTLIEMGSHRCLYNIKTCLHCWNTQVDPWFLIGSLFFIVMWSFLVFNNYVVCTLFCFLCSFLSTCPFLSDPLVSCSLFMIEYPVPYYSVVYWFVKKNLSPLIQTILKKNWFEKRMILNYFALGFISTNELKAQVSFSDCPLSAVCL